MSSYGMHHLRSNDFLLAASLAYLKTMGNQDLNIGSDVYNILGGKGLSIGFDATVMIQDDVSFSVGVVNTSKITEEDAIIDDATVQYYITPLLFYINYYFNEMSRGFMRPYVSVGGYYALFERETFTDKAGKVTALNISNEFNWFSGIGIMFEVDSVTFVNLSLRSLRLTAKGRTQDSAAIKFEGYQISPKIISVAGSLVF